MTRVSRRRAIAGTGAALLGLGGYAGWQVRPGPRQAVLARMGAPLPEHPQVSDLIRYATLAANGHNTQPWLFSVQQTSVVIRADVTRRTPVVDPDDHHLFASLGCAAENLSIAARARGFDAEVDAEMPRVGIVVGLSPSAITDQPLLAAIPERQSTRGDYDQSRLDAPTVTALVQAAARHQVQAVWLDSPQQVGALADLVIEGNSRQIADPAFVRELKAWLRFNPVEAAKRGDGLFAGSSGNPSLPGWLGRRLFPAVFTAEAENAKYARQIDSSAGLMVLVAPEDTPRGWVAVGRACQRLMLEATIAGLKCAFVNQAVEVPEMRGQVQQLLGLGDQRPSLILRIGRGPALPKSLRRPASDVLA